MTDLSNWVTYVLRQLLGHILYWNIINLRPKGHFVKFHILYGSISFVFLNHHQVLIKAPRLTEQNVIYILLIVEDKQKNMVTKVFFIVKPFIARHRGLNVLPTASTFKARRVKNFGAMMCSFDPLFFPNVILSPSLSNKESLVHCFDKSSMATGSTQEE